MAIGALPDGTPVIVSGGASDYTVRVWRLADGTPGGEPLHGHSAEVNAVAVGALPDGTPRHRQRQRGSPQLPHKHMQVWRLADGTPVGEPLISHTSPVEAVAVGALPDGTSVIVSASGRTVWLWRLADGNPLAPPLN